MNVVVSETPLARWAPGKISEQDVVSRARLAACGIDSPVKLLGQYMVLNGNDDDFVACLVGHGLRCQDVAGKGKILDAVKMKMSGFCAHG